MNILHLTIKKEPFEVMVTGEKQEEYRSPTEWITSRLFDKDGNPKKFDRIRFTNGYNKKQPYFECKHINTRVHDNLLPDEYRAYENGLKVTIKGGDIIIELGKVLKFRLG